MNINKIYVILLLFLFLIPSTASLYGKFYGNAIEKSGTIVNTEKKGTFISDVYNDSDKVFKGVVLNSTLYNNSEIKLIFQSSKDNFESIEDREKQLVSTGKGKYYIKKELKGNYKRYVLKFEGKAKVKPEIIKNTKPFKLDKNNYRIIIFIVASLIGFISMKIKDKFKNKEKAVATSIIFLLFLSFLPVASSLDYDNFYVGTSSPDATVYSYNIETLVSFFPSEALNWNTSFSENIEDMAVLDDRSVVAVEGNSTYIKFHHLNKEDGTVKYSILESDDYNLNRVDLRDVEAYKDIVYLIYRTTDENFDASSNNDDYLLQKIDTSCLEAGGSEDLCTSSVQKAGLGGRPDIANDIEISDNAVYVISNQDFGIQKYYSNNLTVAWNKNINGKWLTWGSNKDYLAFNSSHAINSKGTIVKRYPFSSQIIDYVTLDRYYTYDNTDTNVYDKTCTENDTLANCKVWSVGTDSGTTVLDDDNVLTKTSDTLKLRNNLGIPKQDINFSSNILEMSRLKYPYEDYKEEQVNYLDITFPDNNDAFTTNSPLSNVQFEYLVPEKYTAGSIALQIKKEDESFYTTYREGLELNDLDGSCSFVRLVWDNCYNHTLVLENVDTYSNKFAGGNSIDVRIMYNNSKADNFAVQGDIFYSEAVTVNIFKAFSRIEALSPVNNSLFTTLKPTFVANIFTKQEGKAKLFIDDSLQKTWKVDKGFSGNINYEVSNGLTEGSHTYQFKFTGADGLTKNTSIRNFNINSSYTNNFNYELKNPVENAVLEKKDINFKYDFNTTESGILKLWLDNEVVSSRNIESGYYENITDRIEGIEAGTHTWALLFEPDTYNFTYQSSPSDFEITENVTLKSIQPKANSEISEPPVVFKTNLSTNSDGGLKLYVDGKVRKSKIIDAGFNDTVTYEISENLKAGKHTYKFQFTSALNEYNTDLRTFDLRIGTAEDVEDVTGGAFTETANSWAELFGISTEKALMFIALIISIAITVVVGSVTKSGMLGTITLVTFVGGFSLIGWLPQYFIIIIGIIAGYLIAKEVSGG